PPAGTVGTRANGRPAALINIVKTADANTVDVSDGVKKILPELEPGLPGRAKFVTVYDASKSINASIEGMLREGLLGALFAVIVIMIFLRNGRATLIAAVSIPLSVVTAMVLLKQIGVTLNVMTLGGLTVAIGRVVDDSIVVIENIFRHLQRGDARTSETIRVAAKEVTGAITSSTLTTVAVFLPLGLVTGVIGKIFLPFALTVAIALLASLLVAVSVVPLMAKWMLLSAKVPEEHAEGRVMRAYRRALDWSLAHRWIVVASATALFVASLALVPMIGTGFVPEAKEKYITIEVKYPEGTKATEVDKTVKQIEKMILADKKNFELYEVTVGGSNEFSMSGSSGGTNKASLMARLNTGADTNALIEKLRKASVPLEKNGAQITYSRVDASGT
ncbi:MAG: efflux RND transporter permease subunit, partial [Actinobacteria bacterium]